MHFKIEKIGEDSFYLNLLLGLPKVLRRYRKLGMKGNFLERFQPLLEDDICVWEQQNGVLLPYDLRKFYSSVNGFHFRWTMNLSRSEPEYTGKIEVNPLQNLVQILSLNTAPQIYKAGKTHTPHIGSQLKAFEVSSFPNNKILLIFSRYKFTNNIWIYCTATSQLSYLTSDFSSYFRMCISHLGIPNWPLLYTEEGPPQWSLNLLALLAPHLLPDGKQKKKKREFLNKLNVGIFKGNWKSGDTKFAQLKKKVAVDKDKPKSKPKGKKGKG